MKPPHIKLCSRKMHRREIHTKRCRGLTASSLLPDRQAKRITWPESLFKVGCLPHGETEGTEGGVWVLSEVLLEAPVCLSQDVQEYPNLLISSSGSPSVYFSQSVCMSVSAVMMLLC